MRPKLRKLPRVAPERRETLEAYLARDGKITQCRGPAKTPEEAIARLKRAHRGGSMAFPLAEDGGPRYPRKEGA